MASSMLKLSTDNKAHICSVLDSGDAIIWTDIPNSGGWFRLLGDFSWNDIGKSVRISIELIDEEHSSEHLVAMQTGVA